MAERSTAAVDVADSGGEKPLTAEADEAMTDGAGTDKKAGADAGQSGEAAANSAAGKGSAAKASPPELHSGHKLARRYRLEECVTRLDGFSSWRAVDEKLRRAVGIHVLPADHSRARPVLAAARSAALLGDPRFVQVLDAVEENDLVYVVHEWLPDATELTAVLASGPLEPHDAYQLVSQVSQAMAAAHREGLAHLRLTPGSVLRTSSGQYRIRGLAVMAALRGISSDHPQRTDTESIGALLYAALTQRWPYEDDAYGLAGLPKGVGLIAPDQVRAGVHRGLSDLAMRALVNDGATASRQEPPCTTPEELAKAVAAMPRIRPPEPVFTPPEAYQHQSYQHQGYHRGGYGQPPSHGAHPRAGRPMPMPPPPPPPLQTRTGKALKWTVSALLIAALGLGSWQLADALLKKEQSGGQDHGEEKKDDDKPKPVAKKLDIKDAAEFSPGSKAQHPADADDTHDGDASTTWRTSSFIDGPEFAPTVKKGVGIIYDLGSPQKVTGASLDLQYSANPRGYTTVTLYATDSLTPWADTKNPVSGFKKLATTTEPGTTAKLSVPENKIVKTRYVLVWITALPYSPPEADSTHPYKQAIREITFTG
ncbi:protein kinase family protein [Streptomyces sp. LX-29]|uniref:protein kinase family protein n=1 Tax=Streptomyces sp. LX-29 TaxID=2900152 RepID=UPI00240E5BC5|nr:protein kinase family protein [Streptomyces sp. LX-29]WFB08460.1 protein kinase family protein [Streptomyces sp. LX-29]